MAFTKRKCASDDLINMPRVPIQGTDIRCRRGSRSFDRASRRLAMRLKKVDHVATKHERFDLRSLRAPFRRSR